MRRTLTLAVLMMVMFDATSGRAQPAVERPFPPIDEALQDASLVAFRARLREIVARRDLTGLLAVTAPTIMYSFGEGPGVAGFRRYYDLDDEKSELWAELDRVLALGGTFQGPDIFVTPYVYSRWPEELAESIDHVAVTGRQTSVYAEPRVEAPILRQLEPSIVLTQSDTKTPDGWYRLLLPDGRTGYVARSDARNAVDLRAFFARTPAGWLMVICIAGD